MGTRRGALGYGHWDMDTGRRTLVHGHWKRDTRTRTLERDTRTWTLGEGH